MLDRVRNLFQSGGPASAAAAAPKAAASIALRHSNGLREFLNHWKNQDELRFLDLGCTSRANLTFITGLGHGIYTNDVLHEIADDRFQTATDAGPAFDVERWLAENLNFPPARLDAVLLWDLVDYMPEALVKPLLERLTRLLKPGGAILAYFHTKDAGPNAVFYRYHIHDAQTLQLRPGPPYRLQRIFNNRHVENLFRGYSLKFFLARDNLREVLAVK